MKYTPLPRKSQNLFAITHDNLWSAMRIIHRERDKPTHFTCGMKINPNVKDERGVSMVYHFHVAHYKPRDLFKSIMYDPLNIHGQDVRSNGYLHGNLPAYSIAHEKRYGFGILQTFERRAELCFDYTIAALEKLRVAAMKGPKEYLAVYKALRPKEATERAA